MAAQQYSTIGDSGVWPLSASPNPKLGYFLQGHSWGTEAVLSVGPDHSNHTVAVVAQQGTPARQVYGEVADKSSGNLTLTHGISLSNGNLTIANESGGTVTLNGASTVANGSSFVAASGPGPFHALGSYVLNGSLTVSNGSMANFQDAALRGPGTINVGNGSNLEAGASVDMNTVLAGLHVNVARNSELILRPENAGGAMSFHGTISEAAGSLIEVYGAARTAVREIFHTATGTLDLLNKVGTQVASLQFAPGSREYTSISPGAQGQYVNITTSPITGPTAHTLPTIFTH